MPSIYSYQKYITHDQTKIIKLPENNDHQPVGTELATIDNITYISLPDGAILPMNQPEEIASTIKTESLTEQLRTQLKAFSPHCQLIAQRVIEQIRDRYSVDDEAYFSRIGIGAALNIYEFESGESDALLQFGNYVEQCRQWGRDQRALLGL